MFRKLVHNGRMKKQKGRLWVQTSTYEKDTLDQLPRIAWYYTSIADNISEIIVRSKFPHPMDLPITEKFDSSVRHLFKDLVKKIRFVTPEKWNKILQDEFDWKIDSLVNFNKSEPISNNAESIGVFRRVQKRLQTKHKTYQFITTDTQVSQNEGSLMLRQGGEIAGNHLVVPQMQARFRALTASLKGEATYIFGTGPTLSPFMENESFAHANVIFTNSMVKDLDLVQRINPDIIVAADPIFHAGCSKYAERFRQNLQEALNLCSAKFIFPLRDFHIYKHALHHFEDRLIAIPFNERRQQGEPFSRDFSFFPFSNVLTLALIPLAAEFSDIIRIAGCDGRPPENSSYFWTHDSKVQFNDEMDNIQQVHPAFFAIDYNDYYFQHCKGLLKLLQAFEKKGKTFEVMTPSHISALSERYMNDVLVN